MTDFDEQIAEEVDEQNQLLMQDLRRIYAPNAKSTANSLARVHHSLFKSSDNSIPIPAIPQPSQAIRSAESNKHLPFPTHRQSSRYRRLNNIAAILFATLLTGSLVALFMLVRHENTGGNIAHPSSAILKGIHMIDARNGWAFSYNSPLILRTSDGGIHWRDVTPYQAVSFPDNHEFSWVGTSDPMFIDASTAWVPATIIQTSMLHNTPTATPTTTSFVLHTSDGGQTWQKTMLQTDSYTVSKITFNDKQHGWLLTNPTPSPNAASHVHNNEPELFQTSNGGKTWTKVLDRHSYYSSLFANLTVTGINFVNASTGWLAGSAYTTGELTSFISKLYVTHDGGKTWQEQAIPQVRGHVPGAFWVPQFFTAQDGVLPVLFKNTVGIEILATHDGGTTWQSTQLLSLSPVDVLDDNNVFAYLSDVEPQFTDMQHGWFISYETAGIGDSSGQIKHVLYTTNDGGQHWTKFIPAKDSPLATMYYAIEIPDATSAQNVWILESEPDGSQRPTALFESNDGGHTWTQVHAMFPDFIIPKSAF